MREKVVYEIVFHIQLLRTEIKDIYTKRIKYYIFRKSEYNFKIDCCESQPGRKKIYFLYI